MLLLLVFAGCFSLIQDKELNLQVSSEGDPTRLEMELLNGVTVVVTDADTNRELARFKVNENGAGKFSVPSQTSSINISASKSGYRRQLVLVNLTNATDPISIMLEKEINRTNYDPCLFTSGPPIFQPYSGCQACIRIHAEPAPAGCGLRTRRGFLFRVRKF